PSPALVQAFADDRNGQAPEQRPRVPDRTGARTRRSHACSPLLSVATRRPSSTTSAYPSRATSARSLLRSSSSKSGGCYTGDAGASDLALHELEEVCWRTGVVLDYEVEPASKPTRELARSSSASGLVHALPDEVHEAV